MREYRICRADVATFLGRILGSDCVGIGIVSR
jgi:hypothetical protein